MTTITRPAADEALTAQEISAPAFARNAVYLDYNATTPIDPRVAAAMTPYFGADFGNPSSAHQYGAAPRDALSGARDQVAALIGADASEITFTGSCSEADAMAIRGVVLAALDSGVSRPHVITQATEHPAVIAACHYAERYHGARVMVLPVEQDGLVDPDALRAAMTAATVLVTIMHANNETGAIQPISLLAAITHERGALFHSDAAQTAGKLPLDVSTLGVDLLTLVGHKMCAPKGVAALYVRDGIELPPLIGGGGQEHGRRAGTENVPYAVALGVAAALAAADLEAAAPRRWMQLRDQLQRALQERLPGRVQLNGPVEHRLPKTLNISIDGLTSEQVLTATPGLAASTGSACHSGQHDPSPVLGAMGIPRDRALAAFRLSLGRWSTTTDIERAVDLLAEAAGQESDRHRLVSYLTGLGIQAPIVDYPSHSTVEQGKARRGQMSGTFTKNLLLRDKKNRLFLLTAHEDAAVDLKTLHRRIGAQGRVGFRLGRTDEGAAARRAGCGHPAGRAQRRAAVGHRRGGRDLDGPRAAQLSSDEPHREHRPEPGSCSGMSDAQPSSYGDQHAPVCDRIYRRQHTPDAAVAALAAAAGPDGAVLEMGVGTGRLAIPLAALGISVDGIEGSPAMIEQLRSRPGGSRVRAFHADLADFDLPRRDYTVAVCAVSTLFMLPTAHQQQRCLASAARHLRPGGRLIIEAFQIDPTRFDATGHRTEERPTDDGSPHTVLSTHDALNRSISIRHTLTGAEGRDSSYEVTLHYLSTAQLDEMAARAGLTLIQRWHDWSGGPATAGSTDPVSIYQPTQDR